MHASFGMTRWNRPNKMMVSKPKKIVKPVIANSSTATTKDVAKIIESMFLNMRPRTVKNAVIPITEDKSKSAARPSINKLDTFVDLESYRQGVTIRWHKQADSSKELDIVVPAGQSKITNQQRVLHAQKCLAASTRVGRKLV